MIKPWKRFRIRKDSCHIGTEFQLFINAFNVILMCGNNAADVPKCEDRPGEGINF